MFFLDDKTTFVSCYQSFTMRTLHLLLLLFFLQSFYAANDNLPSDASSQALGGVSVVLDKPTAVINNPAFVANFDSPLLAASFSSSFGLERMTLAAAYPIERGAWGAQIQRAGLLDYAEMKYALFYARSFGENFSASLQFDAFSVMSQSNAQAQWAMSGELSLAYHITSDFTLGFHLYNFLNAHYEMLYYDEQIPVNVKLGFAYRVFDNFTFLSEIENSSLYGTSLRAGMEYAITDGVYFRTGGASNPVLASMGIGYRMKNIHIDVAAQAVRTVGKTGAISLAYAF